MGAQAEGAARARLDVIKQVGGEEALQLVKRKDMTREVKAVLDSWSVRFDVSRAISVGMLPDQPFIGAVQGYIVGECGSLAWQCVPLG